MLVTAIPTMFAYERLNLKWCPITARSGVPVHNACFTENVLLTLLTGLVIFCCKRCCFGLRDFHIQIFFTCFLFFTNG